MLEQATATLSPKQLYSLGASTGRVNLWEGSIRSGKTFVSFIRWMIFISMAPAQGELVMVGKSRDSLYRNVLAPAMNSPEFAALAPFIRYRAGAPIAYIFGRRVHILGANDAQSESKIRGMTVVGAYCDELTVLPHDFFKQLLGRMSVAGAQLFATTNPDSPAHWLKVEYLDRLRDMPDWRVFKFLLDDNLTLPADYVAFIKSTYTGLWYQRFVLGMWVAAEGAIFPMWDPKKHVRPWAELPPMQRLVAVGMDYGTTNASTGLLLGISREKVQGQQGSFGRLWLVDEWRYDSRVKNVTLTDSQLSASFREWLASDHLPEGNPGRAYKPRFVVVDPAAASFRRQLHLDGITNAAAKHDVGPGLALMASLLVGEQLMVSDRCEGFINEAPGYAWDAKKSLEGHDVPVKVADHSIDGARYAIATTEQFWRPQMTWPELALAA